MSTGPDIYAERLGADTSRAWRFLTYTNAVEQLRAEIREEGMRDRVALDVDPAHAEIIVQAVNAHQGLVDALADLTQLVARLPGSHIYGDTLDAARSALETARGQG